MTNGVTTKDQSDASRGVSEETDALVRPPRSRWGHPTPRARARTCAGCARAVDRAELVRLVLGDDGEIAVDAHQGSFGRGVHVHPRPDCLARAASGGLARAAKRQVRIAGAPVSVGSLASAIEDATAHRLTGLLASAVRSRSLALGADAVTAACERGEAKLVVVARDAAAAAELTQVRRAVAEGRAVAWGTKAGLGAACRAGRSEGIAVLALSSSTLASAFQQAVQVLDACAASRAVPRGAKVRKTSRSEVDLGATRPSEKPVESRTERGS